MRVSHPAGIYHLTFFSCHGNLMCLCDILLKLPISTWVKREDAIISRLEELGLPMRAGGTGFGKVPVRRRVARWGSEFGGAVYSEELDDK
mmetsp:Transcript_18024/g.18251  ORF Transcript_18024/g.18251 Transcript_18024/m.18251 type:complete len:90 (+) Transcript_18024:46-315(+)